MKILVADDHELIANGVVAYYAANFPDTIIRQAKNKSELIFQLNQEAFDVLIQDLQFGKDDARELLQLIRGIQPSIKALILSTHIDHFSVKSCVSAGYQGYISKGAPISEIPLAIEQVLAGQTYFSKEVEERMQQANSGNILHQDIIELSEREKEVLFGIQNELSTKEIATKLFLSEKTIEAYRSNLLLKFGVKNVAGLVKQAILHGFIRE